MGDTNLDTNKWASPDSEHVIMTDLVKNHIETSGFIQLVRGDTRFWPNTPSSLIDQVWTNCPMRILHTKNQDTALSDHNLIEIKVRIEGLIDTPKEIISRDFSQFSVKDYQNEISKINWENLLAENNLNLANNIF